MPFTGSDICKVSTFLWCLYPRSDSVLFLLDPVRRPFSAPFTIVRVFMPSRLAIFIPPLGVFLERGCHADFVCSIFSNGNVILTSLRRA